MVGGFQSTDDNKLLRHLSSDIRLPLKEGSMDYQLVGKVMAYQGNDG